MRFYVGVHKPHIAEHVARAMVSVNRLRRRRAPLRSVDWLLDSGAFTEIARFGHFRDSPEAYAAEVERLAGLGGMAACVTQDFMCEPFILGITGLTVPEHQRLTIERYDRIAAAVRSVYVLPVLQGYAPAEYVAHIRAYGDRLDNGAWVGVGSVCKRNSDPGAVAAVLSAIVAERPDLRLHGFGIKLTALRHPIVARSLHSADSAAWSYAARMQGRNQNHHSEAVAFEANALAAWASGLAAPLGGPPSRWRARPANLYRV